MEKIELVEVTQKKVNCRYRDSDGTFGSKEYTFITTMDHFIGELVVAKDSKGYVLVQVASEVKESSYTGAYATIISLDEVNSKAKTELRKKEVASQIREAVIRNIENNAFESLVKQYPDMAPMIEEYKASGGSYSDIMPSIVNMLK